MISLAPSQAKMTMGDDEVRISSSKLCERLIAVIERLIAVMWCPRILRRRTKQCHPD
jgi:hypothetical protein